VGDHCQNKHIKKILRTQKSGACLVVNSGSVVPRFWAPDFWRCAQEKSDGSNMNYREEQRKRAVSTRDDLFKDPGAGLFFGKARDFVLKDPSLNLWAGIRDDAKEHFASNGIAWWKSTEAEPTGHLLSSQVACVNHLYPLRQRGDVATSVLRHIEPTIVEALPVGDGFVDFEYIGSRQYLKEPAFTRGANCTSVDAVMRGMTADKAVILLLIEWKYTESYSPVNRYIPQRSEVYDPLISSMDGPIVKDVTPQALYYEPFYQMMRQTLLAWQFEKHSELGCTSCLNVHVIPNGNKVLKKTITSPGLHGADIHKAWRTILKAPEKYVVIDPEEMLRPAYELPDTKSWLSYLEARYW